MKKDALLPHFQSSRHIALLLAAIISAIVLMAAYGKWFHPVETLETWDKSVALFEVFFVAGLFWFRHYPTYWQLSALLFATWGGYAYFWYSLKLPCSCMGEWLQIPSLATLSVDFSFVSASLLATWLLKRSKRLMQWSALLIIPMGATGFLLAQFIYDHWVKNA